MRVLALGFGTGGVQALSAVSQLLFAIWLTPEDYGHWAAATSLLVVVSALMNLGEISGYLASPDRSFSSASRDIWRINGALALVVGVACVVVATQGDIQLSWLMLCIGVNIPLAGYAQLLYAAHVKSRQARHVVVSQWAAAFARVAVGVAIAVATGSPLALGVSVGVYSLVQIVLLRRSLGVASEGSAVVIPLWQRFKWALQALSTSLPPQVDYLVASWLADKRLLGLYFLAYQFTVGVGALVAQPLARSVTADLSAMNSSRRMLVSSDLTLAVCAGGSVLSIALGTVLRLVNPDVGVWTPALPAIVILLGGMPARLITPILDASLVAGQMWRRSTQLNTLDAVGTAVAATAAATGNVMLLACATASWKVVFSGFRLLVTHRGDRRQSGITIVMMLTSAATLISIGLTPERHARSALVGLAGLALVSVVWVTAWRTSRSYAHDL